MKELHPIHQLVAVRARFSFRFRIVHETDGSIVFLQDRAGNVGRNDHAAGPSRTGLTRREGQGQVGGGIRLGASGRLLLPLFLEQEAEHFDFFKRRNVVAISLVSRKFREPKRLNSRFIKSGSLPTLHHLINSTPSYYYTMGIVFGFGYVLRTWHDVTFQAVKEENEN